MLLCTVPRQHETPFFDQTYRLLRTGVTQPEHVRSFARAVCSWETVSPGADTNSPVLGAAPHHQGTQSPVLYTYVQPSLVPSSLYPHFNQFETRALRRYVPSLFSTSMIPSAIPVSRMRTKHGAMCLTRAHDSSLQAPNTKHIYFTSHDGPRFPHFRDLAC